MCALSSFPTQKVFCCALLYPRSRLLNLFSLVVLIWPPPTELAAASRSTLEPVEPARLSRLLEPCPPATVTIQHSRPLLVGSPHKIKVLTDHNNLQYWRDPQKISHQIAREVLELADYNIKIHHLQGRANGKAVTLSQCADHNSGEADNANIVILLNKLFAQGTTTCEQQQDKDKIVQWVDPH